MHSDLDYWIKYINALLLQYTTKLWAMYIFSNNGFYPTKSLKVRTIFFLEQIPKKFNWI